MFFVEKKILCQDTAIVLKFASLILFLNKLQNEYDVLNLKYYIGYFGLVTIRPNYSNG